MRPAQPLALALLLGLLGLLAQVTGAYEENAQAVRDLGVTKGEPIETGFVFWENRFIEGPYVVERRGLDILVNGTCVRRGPQYPPYEYAVEKDPGEPPPGSSPIGDSPESDPRDNYWSRKWRYLLGRFGHTEAQKQILVLCRRSPDCLAIYPDPGGRPNMFVFETKSAEKEKVKFHGGRARMKLDSNLVGTNCEDRRFAVENDLNMGRLLLWWPGLEVSLDPRTAMVLMGVLVSDRPQDQKLAELRSANFFTTQDRDLPRIVAAFQPTDAIRKKVDQARVSLEAKRPSSTSPTTLPNWEKRIVNGMDDSADLQSAHNLADRRDGAAPARPYRYYIGIAALAGGVLGLVWALLRVRRKASP